MLLLRVKSNYCGRLRLLFLRTQKAHFKTTNVKKLDAAVKIYGALIETLSNPSSQETPAEGDERAAKEELRVKVVDKLTSMLSHPFPRIRERVVDELWCRCGVGKGWDLSVKGTGKREIEGVREGILKSK